MTASASLLGKYVDVLSGYAFASQHFNSERRGLPLIRIRDVMTGSSNTFYDGHYDPRFLVQPGELLIGMDGEFNCARWSGEPSLLNQRVCRIRSISPELDDQYLLHYLPKALKLIEDRTSFVTVKHLSSKDIASIPVCLPPADEQRRIAAILNQADDLRRKSRIALEKLSELPQAIFHDMFGPARTKAKGFPVRPLGDLVSVSSGNGLTQSQLVAGPFPVYGGNGINGYHSDFMVPAGTVVIGRVGVYCGAVHVTTSSAWVTDNALIVSTKNGGVLPRYLSAALINANLNQYAGRSAQPLISGGRLYPIKIPVPPLAEQERFALYAAAAGAAAETSLKQLHSMEKLFSSLQYRAFSGEP